MPVATMTSKGQITLRLAVRTALGLSAGNQVDFVAVDGTFMVVPVSIDAMNEAIGEGFTTRNQPSQN